MPRKYKPLKSPYLFKPRKFNPSNLNTHTVYIFHFSETSHSLQTSNHNAVLFICSSFHSFSSSSSLCSEELSSSIIFTSCVDGVGAILFLYLMWLLWSSGLLWLLRGLSSLSLCSDSDSFFCKTMITDVANQN